MFQSFDLVSVLLLFFFILVILFLLRRFIAGASCPLEKDMRGQCVVITGGNTGIGFETAKKLYFLGCKVIIGARDESKSKKAVEQISKISKFSGGQIFAFKLDLNDKPSIQFFAKNVMNLLNGQPLNYLINNAAVICVPQRRLNSLGLENHIAVNHFGHFYLTYLLWPSLKSASVPRIITVSSKPFEKQNEIFKLNLEDINYHVDKYVPLGAYGRSKQANVIFTRQLQRKMNESKFEGLALCIHPGVVNTQAPRQIINSPLRRVLFKLVQPLIYLLFKTPRQGAQTILYAVFERQDKLQKGELYTQCKCYKFKADAYISEHRGKKLWQISQKAFDIKFDI